MTTNGKFNGVVADADGHIMEPGDLWSENLEPKYRDRAMQVVQGRRRPRLPADRRQPGRRSSTARWVSWAAWMRGWRGEGRSITRSF